MRLHISGMAWTIWRCWAAFRKRAKPSNCRRARSAVFHRARIHRLRGSAGAPIHGRRRSYRELIDYEPLFYKGWASLGRALFFQRRHEEAIDCLVKARSFATDQPSVLAALSQTYGAAGLMEKATGAAAELNAMSSTKYVPQTCYAIVEMGLGNMERALAHVHQAFISRELQLSALGVHPLWDPLRGYPVFDEIVKKVGAAQSPSHP